MNTYQTQYKQYKRAKEILNLLSNGDDHSIKALAARIVWTMDNITILQAIIKRGNDIGLQYLGK